MSGPDKKRAFPYYSEVQGFELQRRRLEEDPSRWVGSCSCASAGGASEQGRSVHLASRAGHRTGRSNRLLLMCHVMPVPR